MSLFLSACVGILLGYYAARPLSREVAVKVYADGVASGETGTAGLLAWLAYNCWR